MYVQNSLSLSFENLSINSEWYEKRQWFEKKMTKFEMLQVKDWVKNGDFASDALFEWHLKTILRCISDQGSAVWWVLFALVFRDLTFSW